MAKAQFRCATCKRPVTVVGNNRREADRLAALGVDREAICPSCQQDRNAAESAAAAELAAAESLPSLRGSEKQVAWAETIRRQMIDDIREWLPTATAIGSRAEIEQMTADQRDMRAELVRGVLAEVDEKRRSYVQMQAMSLVGALGTAARCEALVQRLAMRDQASWWIDNRKASADQLAATFLPDILKAEAETAIDPEATKADRELEEAARAEALLLPPGEALSPLIAEVSFQGRHIHMAFPEKNEAIRRLMRREEFDWSATAGAWVRYSTDAGAPDKMAEIAHYLLAAGFTVRLHDALSREMAISGTFRPEQRRRIKRGKGGRFSGWFQITWPKRDDFYDVARAIKGSKYASGAVWVAPARHDEVADFAERHGFAISDAAQGVIDHYRAARAAGIVIAEPVVTAGAVGSAAPDPLTIFDFEIDDEFRDED